MQFITEQIDLDKSRTVIEESANGKSKNYFIEGVFMQADQKNKNGRIYPKNIMESQLNSYDSVFIQKNRALGELGHPTTPTVNLDRASHNIVNLRLEGIDVYGKAKVLDTPCGTIAKTLIDEGIQLAVSSRGLGSVKLDESGSNVVQSDFYLAAIDLVADPSAPSAFVNGILEGVEYIQSDTGYREAVIESIESVVKKTKFDHVKREAELLKIFEGVLRNV